jgi:hypothetical protein
MKKGKTSRIYINIQSWVNPKISSDNWNRIVCNLSRQIKHSVFNNLDRSLFEDKTIVDLDLRTSGIVYGKKSFLNLEINLFTISELDFKSMTVKDSIKKIVQKINNENFNSNPYFEFMLTKNGNIDKSEPQVYL